MNPSEVIVPLIALDANRNFSHFLGSSAFVGQQSYLVTADHVIGEHRDNFAVQIPGHAPDLAIAHLVRRDLDRDIAVFEVPGYSPDEPLEMASDDEIAHNKTIVCFEYSHTRDIAGITTTQPATRLGSVTRFIDESGAYGLAGQDALELSFPALRGASGAPVLSLDNHRIWGIIKANISYELLPVQIESVLDAENQLYEEVRYLLPQAIAIHVRHLRHLLVSL